MKVVLLQDVKGVGKRNEILDLSEGYARNCLINKKLAKVADNKTLSELKSKIQSEEYNKQKEKEKAIEIKKMLEDKTLQFKLKAGNGGKVFGSVTEKDIANKIENELKVKIDKKKIDFTKSIKSLGVYTAKIKLYDEVIAEVKVNVTEL